MTDTFSKILNDKFLKIIAIAIGAIGIIFSIAFFIINCFNKDGGKFYNGYFALILIIMIGLTLYLLRFLLFDKEWKFSRVYLVLALGWGICMQFVMPPISGVDEVQQYYSAYHCSNIMMGIKAENLSANTSSPGSWIQGESFFYMRAEDYYNLPYVDVTFPYQYKILSDGHWFHTDDNMKTLVPCYVAPSKASRYLFAGAGMAIARLLNFGFVGVIFMGRLMNTLSLVAVGWFCLKLLPIGKLQLVTFALFPTVLQLCSSYSYDNMSILISLVLFTLCLYYSQEKVTFHAWDLIILMICLVLLIPNKTVYVMFAMWIFMIPLKKWWTDLIISKKWYNYGILAVMVAGAVVVFRKVVVKYYWRIYSLVVWKGGGEGIEQDATRQAYSWDYLTEHVGETLRFTWEGIKVDWWYNIKHVIGSEIGHVMLNAKVPLACTLIFLVLLIIGIALSKGHRLKKWQYVIFALGFILCLGAIFFGSLMRFTPVEGSQRVQISYRYLIPLYMCLSIALGTDAKEDKKALALIYLQNITLMFTMCGLIYFLLHLRDGMPAPEILQGIIG